MGVVPERLQPLLESVRPLAERFDAAGFKLYLVGGVVRDAVLGRPLFQDLDFTTDARPRETRGLVEDWAESVWTQGERFGTIGFIKGGHRYEVTTHRGEAYRPDSRKPDVVFADAVEDDLARRDFTVNAMALSFSAGTDGGEAGAEGGGDEVRLIDPFGGVEDLAAHRLRTPLSPEESFSDDPLRMLRAARFLAGYDLVPEPELVAAVRALRGRLEIVSAERIR
ncbi:MAG: CCA tRNA nucleotidyltransferase, partial [Acidimicrobiia bacterium]|nr:CCA tRNA nucleotidyltransferase [Acidimicrobiia bacterium]